MTIEELDSKLYDAAISVTENWASNGNPEDLPEIVQTALYNFRKAIIEYLKSKEN